MEEKVGNKRGKKYHKFLTFTKHKNYYHKKAKKDKITGVNCFTAIIFVIIVNY